MKLSEMSTHKAREIMANIAPAVGRLVKVPLLNAMFTGKNTGKDNTEMFAELIPILCRDNFEDVAVILAALEEKTVEEIDEQPFAQTVKDLQSLLDSDMKDFFS